MIQAHADSYYAWSANDAPERPRLEGDDDCDVCVIGAGMTGTSTALHLAERGYRVRLIEGERVAFGASGRSGGQMIIGHNKGHTQLAKMVGADDARKLWDLAVESIDLLRDQVKRHAIDCDLTDGHYHVGLKERHRRELVEMHEEWNSLGYSGTSMHTGDDLRERIGSRSYTSALYDPNSGHLHPMNYTLGLAAAAEKAGAVIHEQTRAVAVTTTGSRSRVQTANGSLTCDHVVLCANAYLGGLEKSLKAKIMPVGSYIVATEPLGEARARELIANNAAIADINFVLNYFRLSADHRMLFGGRVSYSTLPPISIAQAMGSEMVRHYPQLRDAKIDFAWGGNVAITMNRLPHFGRIGRNVYFAHGYSGHGVALTGLAGKLMAEAIAGTSERFDVFSRIPHHNFPGGDLLRTPALVLAMAYFRMRDLL